MDYIEPGLAFSVAVAAFVGTGGEESDIAFLGVAGVVVVEVVGAAAVVVEGDLASCAEEIEQR